MHVKGFQKVCTLQQRLVQASFFNLFIVALMGILLRAFPFIDAFPLAYKNVLHGHSHFAFGGWVMPVLMALVLQVFPEVTARVAQHHWRNIAVLTMVSAYGMLLSFPVQGYGAVSIAFSTLSIVAGFYFSFSVWKALKGRTLATSHYFLLTGLFSLCISSIGPFATGPLIATGRAGTPLYYNAIYYYLHFNYNGWFTFAILALFYKMLEGSATTHHGQKVFKMFAFACVPSFFLSILWNAPGVVFNAIGGAAAVLQLLAFYWLCSDFNKLHVNNRSLQCVYWLSFAALGVKLVLQLLSAFPAVAALAYQNRGFVIAYLHLVLLGFVSLFAMATVFKTFVIPFTGLAKQGLLLFLFSFVVTELLIIALPFSGPLHFSIPSYATVLLAASLFFPLGLLLLFFHVARHFPTVQLQH